MDQAMTDALAAIGVDAKASVARFGGNEALFLKFLRRFPTDATLPALKAAVADGDREVVKTTAHTLKGVCGNLGLTPAFEACSRLMTTLRASDDGDYAAEYAQVLAECERAATAISAMS